MSGFVYDDNVPWRRDDPEEERNEFEDSKNRKISVDLYGGQVYSMNGNWGAGFLQQACQKVLK
jgi:hypothetical protein